MTNNRRESALATLARVTSPLSDTIQAVQEMEQDSTTARSVSIGVSSNVTISLLEMFLRKYAVMENVRLRVVQGNFDDPLTDVTSFVAAGTDFLLLVPCFDNLLPALESQVGHLAERLIDAKADELRAKYEIVLERAAVMRGVFLCTMHRMWPSIRSTADEGSDVVARFNSVLRETAARFPNVRLIDMDEVLASVGQDNAFDARFYFRSKAPYSTRALNEIARRVSIMTRGFGSHFYKVLAVDCDNTLWGGIIGEDLVSGVQLGPHSYPGNIFWRVQHEIVDLERHGVLICLCSKNNAADVDEMLQSHPEMVLRDEHIALKKVNWADKASNLRDIAAELNVGLDSIVFLDDSAFECATVRSQLPEVRTFQVPSAIADYPRVAVDIKNLFQAESTSAESRSKTRQYRQRANAQAAASKYSTNEEFLASLGLRVEVASDVFAQLSRTSELTQKSNQFNVSTKRYSEADISQLMLASDATVYTLMVSDNFGDAGLTGVLVVRWQDEVADVDSFLMSCRVIGRGIEFAVWGEVLRDARKHGCSRLTAEYVASAKNAQVADFFDRLGLQRVAKSSTGHCYEAVIEAISLPTTPWIEVTRAK